MKKKYQASLTTGDLLQEEILAILKHVSSFAEVDTKHLRSKNLPLKLKSEKSFSRILAEAVRRIRCVPDFTIWKFYKTTTERNQRFILFYAVLMTYDLLLDFFLDVVHEKWINLQREVSRKDFINYVEKKHRTTPDLENKSQRSINDMSFNMLKVMRQAGIMKKNNLQVVTVDHEVKKAFERMGEAWFIEVLPKTT